MMGICVLDDNFCEGRAYTLPKGGVPLQLVWTRRNSGRLIFTPFVGFESLIMGIYVLDDNFHEGRT